MDLFPVTFANDYFPAPDDGFPSPAHRGASFVALQSALSEGEAIETFMRRDAGLVKRARRARLRSIARVFVPYYLFHVSIADGSRQQSRLFALDAVRGTLDPYQFDGSVNTLSLETIHSRNRLPSTLSIESAWPLLVDKLRRVVFQTGFFRLRSPRFSMEREPMILHLPYCVGFYADGRLVRLEVLDAVRQRFEGAKARTLFESWLTDTSPAECSRRFSTGC